MLGRFGPREVAPEFAGLFGLGGTVAYFGAVLAIGRRRRATESCPLGRRVDFGRILGSCFPG